jgi:glycosyltransferase involved in cell wall biosynthesis
LTRFELPRTEWFERTLLGRFDRILVTLEADKNALLDLRDGAADTKPVSVVTNGVDLDYFHPDPTVLREKYQLVFSGKMSYHANVSAAVYLVKQVMPAVWARLPEVRVEIVGKDPTPEVVRLGADPRVNVTGMVKDLRLHLQQATVSVSPIVYGAGIQNKVLEAMACKTPVVTTPAGAASLRVTPGQDLVVGDSPDALAASIIGLLKDAERADRIGTSGRGYVEEHHDWNKIVERLAALYDETINTDWIKPEFERVHPH